MIIAAQVGFDDEEPVRPPRPPAQRPQRQPNGSECGFSFFLFFTCFSLLTVCFSDRSDDELPDYADDLPDIVVVSSFDSFRFSLIILVLATYHESGTSCGSQRTRSVEKTRSSE